MGKKGNRDRVMAEIIPFGAAIAYAMCVTTGCAVGGGALPFLSVSRAIDGGLVQTGAALLFWPVQRYGLNRGELCALYLELSQAAITPATSDSRK